MEENNKCDIVLDGGRLCAGIVLYNPDIGKLRENLNHVVSNVEKVFIIDNGSQNVGNIKRLLRLYDTTVVKYNTENKGIAFALNQLCCEAQKYGYGWILTLDQDSLCGKDMIYTLFGYADRQCGIIAPKIVYRGNEQFSENSLQDCEEVSWVITSASLTNISAWDAVGGFDEYLFIDKVDYDFCVRLNRAGYKVCKVNTVSLLHELGNLKCKKVLGRTIWITNHSAFRRYYMSRNSIYLSRKLKERGAMIYIIKNIVKVVCFEDDKVSKLKAIWKGSLDGIEKIRGGGINSSFCI